jgi:hypothetical protein
MYLFAGTYDGVFLSTNNGSNWTAASNGLTTRYVISLALHDSNVFAGTFGGGIFHSTDLGASWTAVNHDLTENDVRALVADATNLFAGTFWGGVYLSSNNGSSWTAVNSGLTSNHVYALALSNAHLFAGTDGGVWRRPLSEMITSVQSASNELPEYYTLEQNYPNPFNPLTVIRYQLPVNSYVTLKVYNVLGQEVAVLVDGMQDAGFKSVEFEASRVGSGVYFYKLVAGEYVDVKRMAVIK